jgi:spore coat protein SA
MKIGIIAPADLPVPAVLGGAIETLIDAYIGENEKQALHELIIYSKYNKQAVFVSKHCKKTKFHWIREDWFYKIGNIIFRILRKIKVTKKVLDVIILYKFIKKDEPDIIIVEGNPTFVEYLKKRMSPGCQIVFHLHALLPESKYGYLADALRFSDKIIVVSNFIKLNLLERFRIDQWKIEVVYNCASQNFFDYGISERDKLNLKNKLEIKPSDFVLIFAGRLIANKGLLELIKACKQIGRHIKFKLLVVGSFGSGFGKSNKNKDTFEEVVLNEIYGFEDNFIFCGYISNNEISAYYSLADIIVIPSLCEEAAGLVAIEGMSAGLPVIYSSKGGIKEYVSPDCGIMVEMGTDKSVEKLTDAIHTLYDNDNLRRNMSYASKNHSLEFKPSGYYRRVNEACISGTR